MKCMVPFTLKATALDNQDTDLDDIRGRFWMLHTSWNVRNTLWILFTLLMLHNCDVNLVA